MSKVPAVLGRGSKINVALLQPGSTSPIVPQTVQIAAIATAAATSITVEALDEPIAASANSPSFLSFVDANGEESFATVTASAAAGATTLTVEPLRKAIANASTAEYPARLSGRTSANFEPNVQDQEINTFDSDGFETGIVTKVGYQFSCDGNFLPLDAGVRSCFHAVNNFLNLWVIYQMPTPAGYTSGYTFKGVASVTAMPIQNPAENFITANITFKFRGQPIIAVPQ